MFTIYSDFTKKKTSSTREMFRIVKNMVLINKKIEKNEEIIEDFKINDVDPLKNVESYFLKVFLLGTYEEYSHKFVSEKYFDILSEKTSGECEVNNINSLLNEEFVQATFQDIETAKLKMALLVNVLPKDDLLSLSKKLFLKDDDATNEMLISFVEISLYFTRNKIGDVIDFFSERLRNLFDTGNYDYVLINFIKSADYMVLERIIPLLKILDINEYSDIIFKLMKASITNYDHNKICCDYENFYILNSKIFNFLHISGFNMNVINKKGYHIFDYVKNDIKFMYLETLEKYGVDVTLSQNIKSGSYDPECDKFVIKFIGNTMNEDLSEKIKLGKNKKCLQIIKNFFEMKMNKIFISEEFIEKISKTKGFLYSKFYYFATIDLLKGGRIDILDIVFKNGKINPNSMLKNLVKIKNIPAINYLLTQGIIISDNFYFYSKCIKNLDYEMFCLLKSHFVKLNYEDYDDNVPKNFEEPLIILLKNSNIFQDCEKFLENGIQINERNICFLIHKRFFGPDGVLFIKYFLRKNILGILEEHEKEIFFQNNRELIENDPFLLNAFEKF